ncbi:MAG TPA: hotdog fold thioesterase [Steroidobacteraceae bacterium]|nr:hotdog fold thioesterase [Steroidobacteraceae bacterium]
MSIWHGTPSLEAINAAGARTMTRHLGIVFTEVGEDFIRAAMPVDERTHQPYGLLHGGASVSLAETVGSTAASLCIDPQRFACVGQDINANHLRPVRSGQVTGTARPVHIGRRSHVWAIEIESEAGLLVCVSRLTMAILERERLLGR